MKSDDKNKNSDNKDDKKECPEGTEWIEDDKAKGCRPLCKLGWYNKDTGAWPCRKCPSGTTTETPGSSECVEDPSLDPTKNTEECKPGETRVSYGHGKRSKCLPECKSASTLALVPCPAATAPRDT